MSERNFPIQRSYDRGVKPHPMEIPWSVAELAYSQYAARYGTSQSLQRLSERGGFGPHEMDLFLPDWRERCDELARLRAEVAELRRDKERLDAAQQTGWEIQVACDIMEDGDPVFIIVEHYMQPPHRRELARNLNLRTALDDAMKIDPYSVTKAISSSEQAKP